VYLSDPEGNSVELKGSTSTLMDTSLQGDDPADSL
jgi:hypothetical protein